MALILWHEWQHVLCIYALGQDNFERFSGLATATQQPATFSWMVLIWAGNFATRQRDIVAKYLTGRHAQISGSVCRHDVYKHFKDIERPSG